jgi:hypothetical protein
LSKVSEIPFGAPTQPSPASQPGIQRAETVLPRREALPALDQVAVAGHLLIERGRDVLVDGVGEVGWVGERNPGGARLIPLLGWG